MQTKEITVIPPEGYEIDKKNSTLERIVFRKLPEKSLLPRTWEELVHVSGYWVNEPCKILGAFLQPADEKNRNVWPTNKEAEASMALAQLCHLRDAYNDGWKPDWREVNSEKYTIWIFSGTISCSNSYQASNPLAFKTKELRDEFLENFRDLIEAAKPLL